MAVLHVMDDREARLTTPGLSWSALPAVRIDPLEGLPDVQRGSDATARQLQAKVFDDGPKQHGRVVATPTVPHGALDRRQDQLV